MLRFITGTFQLAVVFALAGAVYLVIGAYNMPFHDQFTCQLGLNDSAICKTALLLEHTSKN